MLENISVPRCGLFSKNEVKTKARRSHNSIEPCEMRRRTPCANAKKHLFTELIISAPQIAG